jgi:hypothetical protein
LRLLSICYYTGSEMGSSGGTSDPPGTLFLLFFPPHRAAPPFAPASFRCLCSCHN